MKKRYLSFVLFFLLCLQLSLGACSLAKDKPIMNISGADVGEEIYIYYLDQVLRSPQKYSVSSISDEDAVHKAATELCKQYVAANTLLAERAIDLGYYEKSKASEKVNGLWSYFGSHYEHIGVSKQTLLKIESANLANETLLLNIYDPDRNDIKMELLEYYKENFISFTGINGDFINVDEKGNSLSMDIKEKQILRDKFNTMKLDLTDGDTIFAVGERYYTQMGSPGLIPEPNFIQKGGGLYPESFFDRLHELDYEKPEILEYDSYIFLLVRHELSDQDENFYVNRTAMLATLKSDHVNEMLAEKVKSFEAVRFNEKAAKKLLKKVSEALNDKV